MKKILSKKKKILSWNMQMAVKLNPTQPLSFIWCLSCTYFFFIIFQFASFSINKRGRNHLKCSSHKLLWRNLERHLTGGLLQYDATDVPHVDLIFILSSIQNHSCLNRSGTGSTDVIPNPFILSDLDGDFGTPSILSVIIRLAFEQSISLSVYIPDHLCLSECLFRHLNQFRSQKNNRINLPEAFSFFIFFYNYYSHVLFF